jgi:hypothetical protein
MSYAVDVLDQDEEAAPFFAPSTSDALDPLLGAWAQARARITALAGYVKGEAQQAVLHYFLEGNRSEDRGRLSMEMSAAQLFQEDGAVAALNAAYWSKALHLTDVLDCMPQKRRDEWNAQIRSPRGVEEWAYCSDAGKKVKKWTVPPLPDFTAEAVRPTLQGMLAMRHQFLAERVDGIFRVLSSDHVTNVPEGFGRRMIIARAINEYGSPDHSRSGYINDLRCVVAKFMGRDEPGWQATDSVLRTARHRHGEWLPLDGGAIRIRAYKVGTAHLEVHPDIAYRLNQILAFLHPLAIPAEFRTKPKRAAKAFAMMGRPLPFAVLSQLNSMRPVKERLGGTEAWPERYRTIGNAVAFEYGSSDNKAARRAAEQVLVALGGTPVKHYWQFAYHPGQVLADVVASGCIPDQQAHQFYPTPERVAAAAVELAAIGPEHSVLEPSAGQGGLADLLPKDRTTCVEIAPLHCAILAAKGYTVEEADFLAWAEHEPRRFDRVVMNPPFSEGRAKLHTEAAAGLLSPAGVLVAVLPASFRGKDFLCGGATEWLTVFNNEFSGTSVDVVLMRFTSRTAA